MRTRVALQMLRTITAAATQDREQFWRPGNAKSFAVFVIAHAHAGSSPETLDIQTAPIDSPDNDAYWKTLTSISLTAATTGTFVPTGTNEIKGLGEVVRWRVSTFGGTSLTFEVVLFAADT